MSDDTTIKKDGGEGEELPNENDESDGFTLFPKTNSDNITSSPSPPHTNTNETINIFMIFIIVGAFLVIIFLFWQLSANEQACIQFYESKMLECQQLIESGSCFGGTRIYG